VYFFFADLKKNRGKVEPPYGITMFVGLPGTGKTISMVEYLLHLRYAYPGIKIYTNFGFALEDGAIENLDDFKNINDENGVVFAVDEVQLSFQARKFTTFPGEMIYVLTQNRKFRKHFVCTAQLFEHVDKTFRDLTNLVVDCRALKKRWFFQSAYLGVEYKRHYDPDAKKAPVVMWRHSFVCPDWLFDYYDTNKVVEAFDREKTYDKKEAQEYSQSKIPKNTRTPKGILKIRSERAGGAPTDSPSPRALAEANIVNLRFDSVG